MGTASKGKFIYGLSQDLIGQVLYDIVQRSVDKARKAGAQFVVFIGYLEIESATYSDPYGEGRIILK